MIALGWICAQINSIIPSVQSYASLSYSLVCILKIFNINIVIYNRLRI